LAYDPRGGGDLHNNSPGRFEGVVAATTWGNQHCLYHRPRPEDAHSGATSLLPAPWATPHPLGSIKFVEGGEIYKTIHQGDLRGLSLATTWGNRHCLYRRPRPEDACSGATSLLPAPWATPHLLSRQRLRHSSLSFHPPKWIPLPLHQPPRPPMDRPCHRR
jgi:hypothetical protein